MNVAPKGEGVLVRLASGETVSCAVVVLTAGPWANDFLADELPGILRPHRVPVYWFRGFLLPEDERLPAFVLESASGDVLYGCPEWGPGGRAIKIGFHNRQQTAGDPADLSAAGAAPAQEAEMAAEATRFLTGIEPEPLRSRLCFYTMTPDGGFVIDRLRSAPQIVYSASCSGHGFKFAPAVGECLAQLAWGERPDIDLTPFASARFDKAAL